VIEIKETSRARAVNMHFFLGNHLQKSTKHCAHAVIIHFCLSVATRCRSEPAAAAAEAAEAAAEAAEAAGAAEAAQHQHKQHKQHKLHKLHKLHQQQHKRSDSSTLQ